MSPEMRCGSSDRRARVREAECLTGIDEVEYLHDGRRPDPGRPGATLPVRPRLRVRLLGDAPEALHREQSYVIEGGRRVVDVRVTRVASVRDPEGDAVLELELSGEGDASAYTLRMVRQRGKDPRAPEGVDPRYDRGSFSFKPDCPVGLDCADAPAPCPPDHGAEPVLDYLSKDYASFRQLMLDRLSLVLPAWRERHVPDVGVALVELMAYVGDHLSYRQDVVATEAYLDTARLRVSLRRHARLVDYAMHEGANARAWVTVCVSQTQSWKTRDVAFYTRVPRWGDVITEDTRRGATERYEVFLPMTTAETIELHEALGRIRFYTWGGSECCLPRGATRATLMLPPSARQGYETARDRAARLLLRPGDVIILEEVRGPATGEAEHADPSHRHAVRLTRVELTRDPLWPAEGQGEGAPTLYEVEWMAEDALPFPLCLSSLDPAKGCKPIEDVSVARGNVILVDHGAWVSEPIGRVEGEAPAPSCDGPNRPTLQELRARRFRPELAKRPLTFRAPLPAWERVDAGGNVTQAPPPAGAVLRQDPRAAQPVVTLDSDERRRQAGVSRCLWCGATSGAATEELPFVGSVCATCGEAVEARRWTPRRDLLDSSADDAHFVVEMDDEGTARLRFGDGTCGMAPEPWTAFLASYRVGNGPAGNVPSEAIAHVSVRGEKDHGGVRVRNPLPAVGGVAPEPADDVRLLAPESLRSRRERAVVAEDYAELALRDHPSLQRAAAALRWTGSWYEMLVGLDPSGSEETTPALRATVERGLERYRRIGHDLRVEGATYVPVLLGLKVCAKPGYLREHVRRAALDALVGPGGFFRPDRFTFGQALVLSALVAAVRAAPGVLDVTVLKMERLYEGDSGAVGVGELYVGPLEVIQLANDPTFPERGQIELQVGGGR